MIPDNSILVASIVRLYAITCIGNVAVGGTDSVAKPNRVSASFIEVYQFWPVSNFVCPYLLIFGLEIEKASHASFSPGVSA